MCAKIILLAILLLAPVGCGDQGDTRPLQLVMLKNDIELREKPNCGQSVLPNYGCWRPITVAGGCKVMVVAPRHSGDHARLETLGLEVWKCWTGNMEY
ncbi:MAG: hypothetical protein A3E01_08205 [Gammaproteobacteria bacterium RIFCSPHIGHO2_12_FULL_63_22]|nr:MAG: hypothetical protein A3E01_08205 [Gammaproteobacteria bacterium RIFCSPHIGHO2_12_FULL_63_22]